MPNTSFSNVTGDELTQKENQTSLSDGKTPDPQSQLDEDQKKLYEQSLKTLDELSSMDTMQRGLTALNGIYGYVVDVNTGERVYLSLTPYEISPRLADPGIFNINMNNVSSSVYYQALIDKNIEKTLNKATSTALTVSNRLNAAKVTTNFMQEVLSPSLDKRFGSKDDRVGETSRMTDDNGNEKDRSAFMHIVPDVEELGGRLPITYLKKTAKDDGTIESKEAVAYVPVNFNFMSSAYTLTIKEFILSNITESNQEIYTLDKTFDGVNLRFFGSQPKIFSFNGILTNFDDDVIGLVDDKNKFDNLVWNGTSFTQKEGVGGSNYGSMRDTFLSYYKNFLAGTKCKDFSMKLYIYYNWKIVEGYLVSMNINESADNDNYVTFSANMIVKREYNVFEANKGLAKNISSKSSTSLELEGGKGNSLLSQNLLFRSNYRKFAIEESISRLKEDAEKLRNASKDGQKIEEPTKMNTSLSMVKGFEPSNVYPDESEWMNQLLKSICSEIFNYNFDSNDMTKISGTDSISTKLFTSYPYIQTYSLKDFISACLFSYILNHTDINIYSGSSTTPSLIKQRNTLSLYPTSALVSSINSFIINYLKNSLKLTTPGFKSNFSSLISSGSYTLKDIIEMRYFGYYTFLKTFIDQGETRESAVSRWFETYDEVTGQLKN